MRLKRAGLLRRAEIAAVLDQVEAQQIRQERRSTARGAVVHLPRQAFKLSVAAEQIQSGSG